MGGLTDREREKKILHGTGTIPYVSEGRFQETFLLGSAPVNTQLQVQFYFLLFKKKNKVTWPLVNLSKSKEINVFSWIIHHVLCCGKKGEKTTHGGDSKSFFLSSFFFSF